LRDRKPLEGTRILIVEDDPEIRQMLGIVLQAAGAQATTAPSATTALQMLATSAPEALVVDWNLPDMNGGDLLAAIEAAELAPGARMLLITGGLMPDEARRAGRGSSARLLQKPFRPAALVQALAELLATS
jgi:CheY-like chemotaxis protein